MAAATGSGDISGGLDSGAVSAGVAPAAEAIAAVVEWQRQELVVALHHVIARLEAVERVLASAVPHALGAAASLRWAGPGRGAADLATQAIDEQRAGLLGTCRTALDEYRRALAIAVAAQ